MAGLLKKITVSECGFGKSEILAAVMKAKPADKTTGLSVGLLEIKGIAVSGKVGSKVLPDGKTSEWLVFNGEFQATNLITGEVYNSGSCILPGALPQALFGAMRADDGGFKTGIFAVIIGAHFDEKAITSYVFDTSTILAPKASSAMEALNAQVAEAKQLTLASPVAHKAEVGKKK